MTNSNQEQKAPINLESTQYITLSFGAGNPARQIPYHPGDSIQDILNRAELTLDPGQCVTLGRKRINPKKLNKTLVQPDDTLIIAGMPANG